MGCSHLVPFLPLETVSGKSRGGPERGCMEGTAEGHGGQRAVPRETGQDPCFGSVASGVASSEAKKAPVGEGAAVTSTDWP